MHVTLLTLAQAWLSPRWICTGWLDLAKWLTKKNETTYLAILLYGKKVGGLQGISKYHHTTTTSPDDASLIDRKATVQEAC